MRRVLLLLGALAGSACASTPAPPPAAPPPPCTSAPAPALPPAARESMTVDAAKDRVLALVSAGDAAGLFALYDEPMKQAVPLDATSSFLRGVLEAKGVWHKATREPGRPSTTHGVWLVLADRGTWRLEITLDDAGLVAGMTVTEPSRGEPPVARNDSPMSLPFRGEWVVVWGGDRREVNHHVGVRDQRRAADLAMEGPDHKTHRGEGKANADYFVYGQEVLAVADGTVETVVDGVPENVPHDENNYVLYGNYVILRHGPALFSGYMHLQPGKMRVKPGTTVKRGAVLGLVGNSGHSTEPHLHFQLQDGPDGNKSWGIEPVFERVVVTRAGATETVAGYTFLRGDTIRQP